MLNCNFYVDTDNSDLQNILNKLNTEVNEELEVADTFEEWLIQLTEMNHTLTRGTVIPFYHFINKWLLDTMKSEIILGLLDVQFEKKDDQHHNKLFDFNNREILATSHLINNAMSAPSAKVSSCLTECTVMHKMIFIYYACLSSHEKSLLFLYVCTYVPSN